MFKFNLLLLALLTSSLCGFAQSDVFNSDKSITFLGIDYSHVQFVGPVSGWGEETTKSPKEIKDTYYILWNNTIEREPQNFKFAEAVNRSKVEIHTKSVQKANESGKTDHLFVDNESEAETISEKDIAGMIKKYDLPKSGDIGMVLICEQINKNSKSATYWVNFIDLNSGKLLLSKKVIGDGGGFGFKNYWLGSVKSVLKQMKKEFKSWK